MLRTYLEADRRGSRRAALIWVRRAYLGAWDPAGPVVARVEQLATDDPDGEAHLLRGWMRGQGYGYPQDWAAAATDHEVAAAAGNADALFELAVLSGTGRGRPKDEARAREYTDRAAAAGHPRALYNVGAELARGHGRPQDPAAALASYLRAVEKGHPRAAWTAGLMTLSGDGTEQSTARAGELLRQAQYLGLDVDELMAAMPTRVREMVQIAMGTAPERR